LYVAGLRAATFQLLMNSILCSELTTMAPHLP
jgi:hypothetical protein